MANSILDGVGPLVDDWLQTPPKGLPPYYRHRAAALSLLNTTAAIRGTRDFLEASYETIHRNWRNSVDDGAYRASKENWRWKRHPSTSPANTSPEVTLERAIVKECGENWSNQMPTASGLAGPTADKRAAVDLVHRGEPGAYSLIELKVESDNPLFAAVEILMHGLLFIWSRHHQGELGYNSRKQPVLMATKVTLIVLAPETYYRPYRLETFRRQLNQGLAEFAAVRQLEMGFQFVAFDAGVSLEPGAQFSRIYAD